MPKINNYFQNENNQPMADICLEKVF